MKTGWRQNREACLRTRKDRDRTAPGGIPPPIAQQESAPYRTPAVEGLESEPCFDLEGYHLQVTSLENERRIRWIRWKQK